MMKRDTASGSASSSQGSLRARLRERVRAIEGEIMEEFPEWPQWKRSARKWAIVVLALSIGGLVLIHVFGWFGHREQMRRQRERARVIQLISPVNDVREEVIEFVWRPSPIADYYVLELSDASYRLIWRSPPVREVELRLPEAVQMQLHRGERYLWQVRGFDEKGREVASSFFEEILIVRNPRAGSPPQ